MRHRVAEAAIRRFAVLGIRIQSAAVAVANPGPGDLLYGLVKPARAAYTNNLILSYNSAVGRRHFPEESASPL